MPSTEILLTLLLSSLMSAQLVVLLICIEKMDPELQDHYPDKCLYINNVSNTTRRRRPVDAFDGTENQFGASVRLTTSSYILSRDAVHSTTSSK
ncbi:hypothetical protein EI94DRAFT_1744636 [Lactarius quietus]|nr:hypothetical protein EI94DRAFT_1744636 [Lactarius quietus]